MKIKLTLARLQEQLTYDPITGLFTRAGAIAGTPSGKMGHTQIKIDGVAYPAHRLAWLWMTGAWPTGDVDHINGVPADNRWTNLRDVTRTVNAQNRRSAHSNNESGFLGVTRQKCNGRWQARIMVAGKSKSLGFYDAPEQAHAAYIAAKRQFHEGCTL